MPIALGTRVLSRFGGGEQEFPGTISASYSDNTYSIDYDDGDTEDRVIRSLIRILKVEPEVSSSNDEVMMLLEKEREANKILKHEIEQLSTLIHEEDNETEKLMLTLNTSLTEARRVQTEKDEELEKASIEIKELKEKHKLLSIAQSKQPSIASMNKQLDDLKNDLKKAQEAEAAARRSLQQTKKDVKLSSDQLVQSLTDQIKEQRDEHEKQLLEMETQVDEAKNSVDIARKTLDEEKRLFEEEKAKLLNAASSSSSQSPSKDKENQKQDDNVTPSLTTTTKMSEEDIETLKQALNEACANAEDWERKHKEVQILSDQAYEIMKNELDHKDDELVKMHSETARLQRDVIVATANAESSAKSTAASNKLDNKLADQAAAFADRADRRAAQEALREMERFKAESEKYQAKVSMLESEKTNILEENKFTKEKVESLSTELAEVRKSSVLPGSGVSGSAREEELAKEVKRWVRKYNELTDLSDDAYTILSSQLRERDEVAHELNHSLQQAELEINDFQDTIDRLSNELEEAHAAAEAAGRLAEKALHEKHTAHAHAVAERERAERLEHSHNTSGGEHSISAVDTSGVSNAEEAEDIITPLLSSSSEKDGQPIPSSSPESTNELAATLDKLKANWNSSNGEAENNGENDYETASSLFNNFMSPTTKNHHKTAASSPEGPPSPAALATQAAKKHLMALEKEVADSKEREDSLREQLIQARAEIRKYKVMLENESNGNVQQGIEMEGDEEGGGGRGFCGAGLVSEGGGTIIPGGGGVDFEIVKENVRRLSSALMSGDAPAETVAEYDKWETIMAAHPEYLAERRADLDDFLAKHEDRNLTALDTIRRFVPHDIWEISFQTFSASAENMPEKLIKHIWDNKILWWVRLQSKCIAKVHIADLRSKYIFQNLDLTEMRAIMAVLPEQFENDPNGEKEGWRTNILETIRAALKSEEKGTLNKEKIRGKLYFKGGPLKGPYDPNLPLHEFFLTTSDAFAPTPQFQMVSRIDDNAELSNRRSSITGEAVATETKPIKRQVEQLDILKFADNPEMQRRREAFSKDKIMNDSSSSSSSSSSSNRGYHRSMTMGDIRNGDNGQNNGRHVTDLFTQRSFDDNIENNGHDNIRPKTQWEIERESLRLIMLGHDDRTAFHPNQNQHGQQNGQNQNGGYADWEIELAKTKAQHEQQRQQKQYSERNQQRVRNTKPPVGGGGSLLTAGGTLDAHVMNNNNNNNAAMNNNRRKSTGSRATRPSRPSWAAARRQQRGPSSSSSSSSSSNIGTRQDQTVHNLIPPPSQEQANQQRNERMSDINKYKL